MNSAAVRARMTHRAVVQRDQALADSDRDALNQPLEPDWQDVAEGGVPCFLRTDSGNAAVSAAEFVTIEKLEMIIPIAADVRKEDRVLGVNDRLGHTILAGAMRVVAVLPHHTHQEAQLERVH